MKNISRKQKIYQELIMRGLVYIRNFQEQKRWQKFFDKSCYYEAELIHNLSSSIFEESFVQHDIFFLNYQARWYLQNSNSNISLNYDINKKSIKELFQLVPENFKNKLEWTGPVD